MQPLTEQDFQDAATKLDIGGAFIAALTAVESESNGFLPDGRPKILYEAHTFHQETDGKYADQKDRNGVSLSVPFWDKKLYGKFSVQYARLEDAAKLDWEAAHKATSWGYFQILAQPYRDMGYKDLNEFLSDARSPQGNLNMLIKFLNLSYKKIILEYARTENWDRVAYRYNGEGYKENKWDTKFEKKYKEVLPYWQLKALSIKLGPSPKLKALSIESALAERLGIFPSDGQQNTQPLDGTSITSPTNVFRQPSFGHAQTTPSWTRPDALDTVVPPGSSLWGWSIFPWWNR